MRVSPRRYVEILRFAQDDPRFDPATVAAATSMDLRQDDGHPPE
jgi:hypothetical protein